MKIVNYCRKRNKNHEKMIKFMKKQICFKKYLKMQLKHVFCKIKIQEGCRSQKNILNTFLKRSLHDLSVLFIGKMIWLLKQWFKVTKQKPIKHVLSFNFFHVFWNVIFSSILLFFHDFCYFFCNNSLFSWLFRNLEQIFRHLGFISGFGCFTYKRLALHAPLIPP